MGLELGLGLGLGLEKGPHQSAAVRAPQRVRVIGSE